MDFFQFCQNSMIYTDSTVIRPLKWKKITLCLPPARWGPSRGQSQCSGNIVSFRCISSNLIKTRLFIQIYRHPTPTMPKSTPCLLPARWGPRALDSQKSGNIAIFWWISSNFIKTQLSIQMEPSSDPTMPEFILCLPPARRGPRDADPSAVAILPVFDVFLPI